MKAISFHLIYSSFIPHPSSFLGRRSQVVRQRSAKPLFIGSIPIAASNNLNVAQIGLRMIVIEGVSLICLQ
jgi:hypothetical protein